MKYAFIEQHRRLCPVSVQCRVLRVSAAGYHAHLARRAVGAQRRHLSDETLLVHIKAVHAETRSAYVSVFCSWNTARKQAGLPEVRILDLRHSMLSNMVNS